MVKIPTLCLVLFVTQIKPHYVNVFDLGERVECSLMPSVLHHLSLKQRLILFSLAPLLMMSFFMLIRMDGLLKEADFAKRNHLVVQTTGQITELLYLFQNEYGLSTHQRPTDEVLLQLQATRTKALDTLLNSEPLARLLEAFEPNSIEASQMTALLDALKLTGHKLANVHQNHTDETQSQFTDLY
ncbi:MAG: hypothetical protein ACRCWP_17025, partial [Shewanella sp.]